MTDKRPATPEGPSAETNTPTATPEVRRAGDLVTGLTTRASGSDGTTDGSFNDPGPDCRRGGADQPPRARNGVLVATANGETVAVKELLTALANGATSCSELDGTVVTVVEANGMAKADTD